MSESSTYPATEARVINTFKVTTWVVLAISIAWCVLSAMTQQWIIGAIAGLVLFSSSISVVSQVVV